MLISVITINLNNAAGLEATVASVAMQGFDNFEYIVIDGASTDGSLEIIKKYESAVNYWVSEEDSGLYDAMNKGIAVAKGNYLMFLNSGDQLEDAAVLTVSAKYINDNPEADVFYGDAWFSSQNPPRKYLHKHPPVIDVSYFENYHLNHQAALIKSSFFTEFGFYPKAYRWAGDHWMFLQAIVASKTFKHINYLMVNYDDAGVSMHHYDLYKAEARQLWQTLVPGYVHALLDELKELRRINGFTLVKIAHAIGEKLHRFKRQWFKT